MESRTEYASRIIQQIAALLPDQRAEEWIARLLADAETSAPDWSERAKAFARGLWAAGIIPETTLRSIEEDIDHNKSRSDDDLRTLDAVRSLTEAANAMIGEALRRIEGIEDKDRREEAEAILAMLG